MQFPYMNLSIHSIYCMQFFQSVFYPSCFCLPDNKSLMHGQQTQPEMSEDIYDESNWTNEQVLSAHIICWGQI